MNEDNIKIVVQAVKTRTANGKVSTMTTIVTDTGLDFYEARDAVEAASRRRFLDMNYSPEAGSTITAR